MKRLIIIPVLAVSILIGCSKKEEKKIVEDIFTKDTSVTSVLETSDPIISKGNEIFLEGRFEEAVKYYEEGLSKNRAVAYYNMGVAHYLLRDITAAEKSFRSAVEEDPTFDEAVMNLVAVLAEQEKSIEAEEYVSRLVNKNKSARVYVDMANLSLKNGKTAQAAYYYEKAIDIDSKSAFVVSNYANYLISIGSFTKGRELLEKLPEKDFNVNYNLAYVSWLESDQSKAYIYALKAAEISDGSKEGQDKLAELFRLMKQYKNEADTLRKLLIWSKDIDYRIRLVISYLHTWDLERADDESVHLLNDYPDNPAAIIARYRVILAKGIPEQAGKFIKEENARIKDDMLTYYTVKHICMYDFKPDEARNLLAKAVRTPIIDLAHAAYYIVIDNSEQAYAYLNRVAPALHNDYYVYKASLAFKANNYRDAQTFASKIEPENPEFFWYNLVLAWNLNEPEKLKKLLNDYKADFIIASRVPRFEYKLVPTVDMEHSFKFNGTNADIAGNLLYPVFVEPDEMYPFLTIGYRLLQENERRAALSELQKSIEYSDALKLINSGVSKIIDYNYDGALVDLQKAEKMVKHNPFVQYNAGVAAFYSGNYEQAGKYFVAAYSLNPYFSPAFVGAGLCDLRVSRNEDALINFNKAITTSYEYADLDNAAFWAIIPRAKYLAMIAKGAYGEMDNVLLAEKVDDNFIKGMKSLSKYFSTHDFNTLESLNTSVFYRSKELHYLFELSEMPMDTYRELKQRDFNTTMAAKYVTAVRNRSFTDKDITNLMTNKNVLTDIVNIASLLRDKELGLKYLRILSGIDPQFAPQYKASLYFFTWLGDFVNAEASYVTLNRLGYVDNTIRYYMALYFLVNYNRLRLEVAVTDLAEILPGDYRVRYLSAFRDLAAGSADVFVAQLALLMSEEPYLLDKASIRINLRRF